MYVSSCGSRRAWEGGQGRASINYVVGVFFLTIFGEKVSFLLFLVRACLILVFFYLFRSRSIYFLAVLCMPSTLCLALYN